MIEVVNPACPGKAKELELLVDSGVIYSTVPERVLPKPGIRPLTREEFRLANDSLIRRRKGAPAFKYGTKVGGADVIFGEPGDSQLPGMLILEALGLILDPLWRELKPSPMIFGGWPPPVTLASAGDSNGDFI
jgi:hypothetical protein